ncbi:hypothetical protein, conserved [Eimeria brunetti]|uniref:Serpin domain-containing protein n=1 Tax=Eimeria brunetti TaxID=51314 RepID=U6LEZ0_9EIME|nr:hypothetical protein, conserved [Eimeria brunetti]
MLREYILLLSLFSSAVCIMGHPGGGYPYSDNMTLAASELYNTIAAEKGGKGGSNFVFSPFSILSVFKMAQMGARGATRAEMDQHLSFAASLDLPALGGARAPWESEPAIQLETANRMYVESSLAKDSQFIHFAREVLKHLKSEAVTQDFQDSKAAADTINAFVEEKTKGHIKELVPASLLSPETRMVLINALYFKGPWAFPFLPDLTTFGSFCVEDGDAGCAKEQQVKFMQQRLERGFGYFEGETVKVLSLPYADWRFSLYVFLPQNISQFEEQLLQRPEIIEELVRQVDRTGSSGSVLDLSMPLIKLSPEQNRVDLVEVYKSLGVRLMFEADKADFSGISRDRQLFVSSFLHQADFMWNEEGTEAAAATAMLVAETAAFLPKRELSLAIDRPFLFQVRVKDTANSHSLVLLSGRITDARAAQ